MKVCIASTLAAFKCLDRDPSEWQSWLTHIEAWRENYEIDVLAVLQIGQGKDHAFEGLRKRLEQLGATVWTFSIDTGEDRITTNGRLKAICAGRNLAHEYVNERQHITHLLFIDSDVEPPPDGLEKLLEVDHPIVGGFIPTYGSVLDGPRIDVPGDVRGHWNSAGALLLQREAVRGLRWGWDLDRACSDDPWFADRAEQLGLGQTWVRHDSIWNHHPGTLLILDHRGHDLSTS